MIELVGIHNKAKVFTNNIESSASQQIIRLLDQEFIKNSKVRIMPDVHAGMGCPIGTTMTITNNIVPNLVGVDIGCGMETAIINDKHIELSKLDKAIHKYIPAGFKVRSEPHQLATEIDLSLLRCAKHVDRVRAYNSIGTLGGGNHFIELGKDEDGILYLIVHSGSRNLGKQVAEFYQKIAAETHKVKIKEKKLDRTLAHLEGQSFHDYLHDMAIIQRYAEINRMAIIKELKKRIGIKTKEQFTTTHNYVDLESMILRKGAISAKKDERILIPMNMKDGCLICEVKGNPDWNFSAPHGAGRLMSRTAAKESFTLNQFKKSMEGIYSSTINNSTLDEAPFAYKPMEEIIANINDTADIVKMVKPIYNFKAAE